MRGCDWPGVIVAVAAALATAPAGAVGAQRCDQSLRRQFPELSVRFDWSQISPAGTRPVDDERPDVPMRAALARLHPFAVACLRSLVHEVDENTTVAVARDLISRRRDDVFLRLAGGALSWSEANHLMAQIAADERRIGLRARSR